MLPNSAAASHPQTAQATARFLAASSSRRDGSRHQRESVINYVSFILWVFQGFGLLQRAARRAKSVDTS
jgi:hypothetical protein